MSDATPLFDAIAAGDADRAKDLAKQHPELLDALDSEGYTPLVRAKIAGKDDVAAALLDASADTIFKIAALDDKDRCAEMVEADGSIAAMRTADGFGPLHIATLFGADRSSDILLEAGCDMEGEADHASRMKPMHCAALSGVPEPLEVLLSRGADPDAQRADGLTPLMIAAVHGLERALLTIVHYHADVDIESNDGKTAKQLATEHGHERLAQLIPE